MPRQRDSKHDKGRTLDHFFPYKKLLAEKKHDRSRNPKLLKPRLRHKPSTCNNPDIIVIDSDDDELQVPVTCTGVVEKQRRPGQDVSMDVETVDADEISGRRVSAVNETTLETQILGPNLLPTSSTITTTITTTTNSSTCTFGKPYLLSEGASVNPFLFGSPGSLLSPSESRDPSSPGLRIVREYDSHPQTLEKQVKEDNVRIGDLTEDWLMGDDENESEDKKGDVSDDYDDIEFVEEREVFLDTVCPCCEKGFDGRQSPVRHSFVVPEILYRSDNSSRKLKFTLTIVPRLEAQINQPVIPRSHRQAQSNITKATLSLSSCPPSGRTRHGKRRQPTRTSHSITSNPIEAGERLLSTRYCRACPSLSMLFAMVPFRVLLPIFSRSCLLSPLYYFSKNLTVNTIKTCTLRSLH